MAESSVFRVAQQVWQRANIMAAANYFREQLARTPDDERLKSLYDGLLEVLDPSRRAARQYRELTAGGPSAKAERRRNDRRGRRNRRQRDAGASGAERRKGADRRTGRDRRR